MPRRKHQRQVEAARANIRKVHLARKLKRKRASEEESGSVVREEEAEVLGAELPCDDLPSTRGYSDKQKQNVRKMRSGGDSGDRSDSGVEEEVSQSADLSSAVGGEGLSQAADLMWYELEEDDIRVYLSEEEEEVDEDELYTETVNDQSAEMITKMPAALKRKKLLEELRIERGEEEEEKKDQFGESIATVPESVLYEMVEAVALCEECFKRGKLEMKRGVFDSDIRVICTGCGNIIYEKKAKKKCLLKERKKLRQFLLLWYVIL